MLLDIRNQILSSHESDSEFIIQVRRPACGQQNAELSLSPGRPSWQKWAIQLVLLFIFSLPTTGVGLELPTNEITDIDILHAVEREFRSDDALNPDTVDVSVREGVVTLSGEAQTILVKRQAERMVGSLKGVRSIINRLTIYPTGQSNEKIHSNVKSTLADAASAAGDDIEVSVNGQGIVLLTGTVASYVEKINLESIVADARGVTQIENSLSIKRAVKRRDASELKAEIARRFELSPFLAEGLIEISVEGDSVELSGKVGSVNERKLAHNLAWLAGIEKVETSELQVDSSRSADRRREKFITLKNDFELRKAVEDALLYDWRIRNSRVNVSARLAAITLSGTVSSLDAKMAAQRTAESTLGVRRVINSLRVTAERWPGDLDVTEKAKAAIARDAHLGDLDLHSSSHFGKVYVNGQVNTQFEKQRVNVVLANLRGVRDVVNRTTIDANWVEKHDSEILEDTEIRLRWSPYLDAENIAVDVEDGVVTLSGVVDTWQDKKAAARHAKQGGAKRVKNLLRVRLGRDLPNGIAATLIPNQTKYVVDRSKTGKAFRSRLENAKHIRTAEPLPDPPNVDLVLRLKNENPFPYRMRVGHDLCELELSLVGEGAVKVPIRSAFTADFRMGREVILAPGENFDLPIKSLQQGFRKRAQRWYWTEPGTFSLQATYHWPTTMSGVHSDSAEATPVKLEVVTNSN